MSAKAKIGFIGMGFMGVPMTRTLATAGFAATVWNRSPSKCEPLAAEGIAVAASPAELARASDLVLLCVTGTAAVEEVVFGAEGVAAGGAADKLVIDFSTTDAEATRRMAARLEETTGMGWIDAPVSGGPPAAAAGTLTIMAGGAAADIERARPAMAALAGQFTHMGPVGAGQVTKMINQILVLTNFCVVAEALKLAENAGIDAGRIPECLKGGYADSRILQYHWDKMRRRDFEPPSAFAAINMKDLDMIHDIAKATNTPTPMSAQAANLYRLLIARGHGGLDTLAIFKLYDDGAI